MPEFGISAVGTYYLVLFFTGSPFLAIFSSAAAVYMVNRLIANKPEGAAFRTLYRFINIGGFIPTPKWVKRFEI